MARLFNVLVVDDSSVTRAIIGKHLQGTEFHVVGQADNGKDAVTQYQLHSPDLVLLDIVMPDQTGDKTLERIMEINPKANVVMVSSMGTEDAVTRCLEIGARNFLHKPFDKDALLNMLKNAAAGG